MKKNEFLEALKILESYIKEKTALIPFKVSEKGPNTFKTMTEYYNKNGHLLIYSGDSDKTIFSSPEINIRFRALHDYFHYITNLNFSFEAEKALSNIQARHAYNDLFKKGINKETAARVYKIINAEIKGQIQYYERTGNYVSDQKAFILDYLGIN